MLEKVDFARTCVLNRYSRFRWQKAVARSVAGAYYAGGCGCEDRIACLRGRRKPNMVLASVPKACGAGFQPARVAEKHEARPVGNRPHRLLEQTLSEPTRSSSGDRHRYYEFQIRNSGACPLSCSVLDLLESQKTTLNVTVFRRLFRG